MLLSALTTPPNYLWQQYLERSFPTLTPVDSGVKGRSVKPEQLNISHVVKKFILEQSIGSTVNTMLYLCALGWIRGDSSLHVYHDVKDVSNTRRRRKRQSLMVLSQNFWPLLVAGYRFWPFVCLLNLILIPMDYRALVGSLAGLGWGVFLTMR